MKDLCIEDKQRIANLIKELARLLSRACYFKIKYFFCIRISFNRIGDEKKKLEKSLEDERKLKNQEIKEALMQQELILSEKESEHPIEFLLIEFQVYA